MLFNEILADPVVKDKYGLYMPAFGKTDHTDHSINHALSVVASGERVARLFNLNEKQIDNIKVSALLHDIGINNTGRDNHAHNGANWVQTYLQGKNINGRDLVDIVGAVRYHSCGSSKELTALIVTFADKIDYTKSRLLPNGYNERGCRQVAYVLRVDTAIENNCFVVNFVTDGKIDMSELREYYFLKKIFSATENLARHFGLSSKVCFDGDLFEM